MDWPEETILKMIEVYKTKGLLWNPKDRNYSKKSLRDEAWQEISNEINVPEEECKRKMNSLLASYRREKSKIKKSKETEKRKFHISIKYLIHFALHNENSYDTKHFCV